MEHNLKSWNISALLLKHKWHCSTFTHAELLVSSCSYKKGDAMEQYLHKGPIFLFSTWTKAQKWIICPITGGHSFTSFRGHYLLLQEHRASASQRVKDTEVMEVTDRMLFWPWWATSNRKLLYNFTYTVQTASLLPQGKGCRHQLCCPKSPIRALPLSQ